MATRIRGTSAVMFPLIARYLRGTQHAEVFCQEHGITRSQLTYWRRKYAASSSEVVGDTFVEVSSPVRHDGGALMELQFPGGACLRVFSAVPSVFLSALIHGEGGCSC